MEIYECNNCDKGTCYSNHNNLYCNAKIATWEVAEGYSLYRDNSGILVQPVTKEEPELMTFFDAWEKAKKGDMIKHLDGYLSVIKGSTPETFKIELGDITECRWQIIPAGPVVLTDQELYDVIYKSWNDEENRYRPDLIWLTIKHARQNFRLERDIELRPAIEAAMESIMGGRIEEKKLEEELLKLQEMEK